MVIFTYKVFTRRLSDDYIVLASFMCLVLMSFYCITAEYVEEYSVIVAANIKYLCGLIIYMIVVHLDDVFIVFTRSPERKT